MAAKFLDHNNRDDDGDGNENGKKVIGLYKQNNNFARARARFLYISRPSMHDCDNILSNFTHPLYEVHEHDKKKMFSFSQLRYGSLGSNPIKFRQHLAN